MTSTTITYADDADFDWLLQDHRDYCCDFEDGWLRGTVDVDDQPRSFNEWLWDQPADYLAAHGVTLG